MPVQFFGARSWGCTEQIDDALFPRVVAPHDVLVSADELQDEVLAD
jgi:hypothetical protein